MKVFHTLFNIRSHNWIQIVEAKRRCRLSGAVVALCTIIEVVICSVAYGQYTATEPVLWLTPTSPLIESNGAVESWISAHDITSLSQINEANRPQIFEFEIQLAHHRTVKFSNDQSQFLTGVYDFPQPTTIIAVFRREEHPNPEFNGQTYLYDTPSRLFLNCLPTGLIRPGLLPTYASPVPNDCFIITTHIVNDEFGEFYENGELKVSGFENRTVNGDFHLGASAFPDRYFQGSVAEIIVYDQALDEEERGIVLDSLKAKFAPPPSIEDVVMLPGCERVLEVEERFKTYDWYRIVGDEELLLGSDTSEWVVTEPGEYVVEVTTIFGDITRDTVEVITPSFDSLFGTTVCDGTGVEIDLGITDPEIELVWSDTALSGPLVYIENSGSYTLELTQPDGCSHTVDFEVTAIEQIAEIQMPQTFCAGNQIFIDVPPGSDLSVLWNTGSDSISIIPDEDGVYWVSVENVNGCIGADTVEIEIAGLAPTVQYSSDPLCAYSEVNFLDESVVNDDSEISAIEWIIDGDTLQGSEVSYSLGDVGSYQLQLNVATDAGCEGMLTQIIEVHPIPETGFIHALSCSGQTTLFEDTTTISSGNLSTWHWDFGNGNSAVIPSPVNTFETPGVFPVILTVTSVQGCADSVEKQVAVYPSPEASFDWDPTCVGQPMTMQSTTDTSLTGSLTYAWNANEVVYSGQEIQHEFLGGGTFEVTHEVWTTIDGSSGCYHEVTQTVVVSLLPVVQFDHGPACSGQSFSISDQSEPGMNDEIISWQWIAEGIVIDTTETTMWMFEEIGEFPITLEVTTASGCIGSVTDWIDVGSGEDPEIVVSPEIGLPPLEVQFENINSYGQYHQWDFGDGFMSEEEAPVHTYQDTGVFEVSLLVFDEAGCYGTAEATVFAIEPIFDVAVESVSCTLNNGLLTVSCVFANYGNHRLTEARLNVHVGNGTVVTEFWEGDLAGGQLESFSFQSSLGFDSEVNEPYFCVEVGHPNGSLIDHVPENNERCKSFSTEALEVFTPFPNPADDEVVQLFSLSRSADVTLRLVQPDGKVVSEFSERFGPGLNRFELNTRHLRSGIYILHVEVEEVAVQSKVLILRD